MHYWPEKNTTPWGLLTPEEQEEFETFERRHGLLRKRWSWIDSKWYTNITTKHPFGVYRLE